MNSQWLRTARNNAFFGVPRSDAARPDPLELEIAYLSDELFVREGQQIRKDAESVAEQLNRARADLNAAKRAINARLLVTNAKERVEADLRATRSEYLKLLKNKQSAYSYMSVFKSEHGLTRPAAKRKASLDILAPITVFLIIETLNVAYFYQARVGPLAGASVAFCSSLVIALLGFQSGFLGRYVNAKTLPERIGGCAQIILAALLAIYLASVTATFRTLLDTATQYPDKPPNLSAQPLDIFAKALSDGQQIFLFHIPFHGVNATLLFALAIIAFVNAAFVGYTCIDPVPGYSEASERFEHYDAGCRAVEARLRSGLLSVITEATLQRARFAAAFNEALRLQGEVAISLESCTQELAELAQSTNNSYKRAVTECRAENARHRTTPPPQYFAEPVADLPLDTDPLLFRDIRCGLAAFRDEIAAMDYLIAPLSAEVAEMEQQSVALSEKISQNLLAWDGNERAPASLRLSGWRQFDDLVIDFHPRLTVITGANGSGKTTILNILAINLGWSVPFASVPSPARAAVEFASNVWRAVIERLEGSPSPSASVGVIQYRSGLKARILVPASPAHHRYVISYDVPVRVSGLYIPSHRPVYVPVDVRTPRRPIDIHEAFDLYTASIRAAWTDTEPNTSSPVRLIKETLLSWSFDTSWHAVFDKFSETLYAVLPSALGFRRLEKHGDDVLLICLTGTFTLDSVSGGIAAIIDMTWQIYLYSEIDRGDGFLVLVDEPENHLHPEMQRSVLFRLTERFQRAQFIVASHSPLVVTSVKDATVYALAYANATDEESARRIVHGIELMDFERTGTASDVLRKVLGLDYTMPVWAANILDDAIQKVSQQNFNAKALAELKRTLDDNNLGRYLPETLAKISDARSDDGSSPISV